MSKNIELNEFANLILNRSASLEDIHIDKATRENLWVYRNNFLMGHIKHLKEVFPISCEILGDRNFNFFVAHYLDEYPPQSENLNNYGASLSIFFANREELKEINYISYLSKLEWAVFSQDISELELPRGVYSLWEAISNKEDCQQIIIDENEIERIKFE
ncbi:DNA-binding domain-containing protein [Halobacteriovorax sp. HLS]|uniref:HvfC/BufC N-terminal domain-containing protein n=1 Tax=Halobacteriovorax sp. HLS TaxID=2234000 RepID=UPI000FD71158|nr:DNA-binding domain-containing protein [Halobacteriovorax sp. HLS]